MKKLLGILFLISLFFSNVNAEERESELNNLFTQIILADPKWFEAWNKRATVLYMMGRYEDSQKDIDQVLRLEKRHFGALSGQGLVQTELKNLK